MSKFRFIAAIILGLLAAPAAHALPGVLTFQKPKPDIAATPPMGWNSWNHFHCDVDEAKIKGAADGMVASGMKDAGYQYVVIDDCWQVSRDADGKIVADPVKFPSGIKALADYVHSRGLKFGIYSDAGVLTCAKRPGGRGHEYQDARTYAEWGVDYLKYDWCNTGTSDAASTYTIMAMALRDSGRDIVFSLCEWGLNKPRDWAAPIGHLWRTTGDIKDVWNVTDGHGHGVLNILDEQVPLVGDSGPNQWNDPDMLEVGNGGMTDTEYRSHFSLWAMLAAPLIAGNDLSKMDEATKTILTNKDVIAIDQDALGIQGRRAVKDGDYEVWVRPLKGGDRAVILLNRSEAAKDMSVNWETLDMPAGLKADVKDLWSKAVKTNVKGSYGASVPSHGVIMLRVTPKV
ncbi:MAG TPA: glycoside hydrolase family 27 protein [Asticcacaulis sp.]|nr:glycoside hydrolase family 27 protein [Asticcacaulis sp.]